MQYFFLTGSNRFSIQGLCWLEVIVIEKIEKSFKCVINLFNDLLFFFFVFIDNIYQMRKMSQRSNDEWKYGFL